MLSYVETLLVPLYSAIVKVPYICLTKYQMLHERRKHIDVRYHFIREVIAQENIKVQKISTHENPADMMTKPVPSTKLELCSSLVGMTV